MSAPCAPARRRAVLLVSAGPDAGDPWQPLAAPLAAALPAGWQVAHAAASALSCGIRSLVTPALDDLVVVLLHPQFRADLLAPIVRETYAVLAAHAPHVGVTLRTAWYDDAGYVHAIAAMLAARLGARPAHAVPHLRFVTAAPADARFHAQARRTAELVAARLGLPAGGWSVGAPGGNAHGDGDAALVVPLPFPTHPACGDTTAWVGVLRHLVLHGPEPATDRRAPLLVARSAGDDAPAALVMLGACLASSLGPGAGPPLRFSDPRAFADRPHSRRVLRGCLDRLRAEVPDGELLLWTTCQRVELYAWVPEALGPAARAGLEDRLRAALFGAPQTGIAVNVLREGAARHHLVRTACGLNSGLPGDRDVVAQLQTALHMADAAGTAGRRAHALVDDAVRLAHGLHTGAPWGRFSTGYCAAALTRICEVDGSCFDRLHHVVIGGSTTSRAVLAALVEEHGVPCRQLTLVYRDHHGQMRQLRAALGGGRRLRVHAYDEESVLRAVADADVVVFGIDQADPVLDAAALAGVRDVRARPLTVIDFNASGSLAHPERLGAVTRWSAGELDRAVAAQAAVTISRTGFGPALADAEARVARAVADALPTDPYALALLSRTVPDPSAAPDAARGT